MERFASEDTAVPGPGVALIRPRLARELRELIAALDRRVQRAERAGEASIARDAAGLKVKALRRIEELDGDTLSVDRRAASAQKRTTAG
jgi:hypothetical protein